MKHVVNASTKTKLTGVNPDKDIQPNAVDLRIGRVFHVNSDIFVLTDDTKRHRGEYEILPNNEGFFCLSPGYYKVIMENTIIVGDDEDGFVITRSTLVRNGCQIVSGLYDSGYEGLMAAGLKIDCGVAKIQKGCRIGQYLCFGAESVMQYDGDYGVDKTHDQKYNK